MIYNLLSFSLKKTAKNADVSSHRRFRRVSIKNVPQYKSGNVCNKSHASFPILSIFLLTTHTIIPPRTKNCVTSTKAFYNLKITFRESKCQITNATFAGRSKWSVSCHLFMACQDTFVKNIML